MRRAGRGQPGRSCAPTRSIAYPAHLIPHETSTIADTSLLYRFGKPTCRAITASLHPLRPAGRRLWWSRILGSVGRFCALSTAAWCSGSGYSSGWLHLGPGDDRAEDQQRFDVTRHRAARGVGSASREEFPPQQNGARLIVFHVDSGQLTDSALTQAIQDSIAAVRQVPYVYRRSRPDGESCGRSDQRRQPDGTISRSRHQHGGTHH